VIQTYQYIKQQNILGAINPNQQVVSSNNKTRNNSVGVQVAVKFKVDSFRK